MEELIAARYNLWWYLSLILPAVVMVIGTFWHKRYVLVIAIILSLFTTYALCNISVQEKWKVRLELAQTEEQLEYATADGANLVFTAILIGPLEAVLYTSLWGFIGWKGWPRLRRTEIKRT
jgi:hypothetical protein